MGKQEVPTNSLIHRRIKTRRLLLSLQYSPRISNMKKLEYSLPHRARDDFQRVWYDLGPKPMEWKSQVAQTLPRFVSL